MKHFYVMPLGCDYDQSRTAIGAKATERCERALREVQRLRWAGHTVTVVLAPGTEPVRRQPGARTMASMMADWFRLHEEFKLIVNEHDGDIAHNTIGEMQWGLQKAIEDRRSQNTYENSASCNDVSDMVFMIVSNRRHLCRVRCILRLLFDLPDSSPDGFDSRDGLRPYYTKPSIAYADSSEEPPTVVHESGAYIQLLWRWFETLRVTF